MLIMMLLSNLWLLNAVGLIIKMLGILKDIDSDMNLIAELQPR